MKKHMFTHLYLSIKTLTHDKVMKFKHTFETISYQVLHICIYDFGFAIGIGIGFIFIVSLIWFGFDEVFSYLFDVIFFTYFVFQV